MQRLVGALSRRAEKQADFFLSELQEAADARVMIGVKQARKTTRDACARAKQPVVLDQPDEQTQARVQMRQQENIEREVGCHPPFEGVAWQSRQT